jgi:hypothetical protein
MFLVDWNMATIVTIGTIVVLIVIPIVAMWKMFGSKKE